MRDTFYFSKRIFGHVVVHPDKTAVFNAHGQGATYQDFQNLYQETKEFLETAGISGNQRVAILGDDPMVYALLGLPLMENATYMPLDPELEAETLKERLQLIKANILICQGERSLEELCASIGIGYADCHLEGTIGKRALAIHLKLPPSETTGSESEKIAVVVGTSGTTSVPKIVPVTYTNDIKDLENVERFYHYDSQDLALILTNKYSISFINAILSGLTVGGATIVSDGYSHLEILNLLEKYPVTWFRTTPAMLGALATHMQNNQIIPGANHLEYIRSSGAPLTLELKTYLESAFHTRVIQTYGITEVRSLTSTYKEPKGYKEGSAGIRIGPAMRIQDGEIQVSGATVFPGYENPELDNRDYLEDGWFHTGDQGYFDDDGYLFITGRIKEMINRGGEKISPYEVEAAILKHPSVSDTAVFPYPNNIGSEDAGCVVVLKPGATLTLPALRDSLQGRISPFKMPTKLYLVDEIPVSPRGKVQRSKLYDQLLKETPTPDATHGEEHSASQLDKKPLSMIQTALLRDWCNLFPRTAFGLDDSFFALGGDSMMAASLFSRIEAEYQVHVPMDRFFREPNIRWLAAYLESQPDISTYQHLEYLVPIKASGSKPPLICLHTADGEAVTYHGIGSHMAKDRPVYALRFLPDKGWEHPLRFEALSEAYARDIRRLTTGICHLTGTCYGGALALETARALEKAGSEVGLLAMLDSAVPSGGRRKYKRLWVNALDQLKEKSTGDFLALVRKKAHTLMHLVSTRIRKRLYAYATGPKQKKRLIHLAGKHAALSYAFSIYTPEHYAGRIYYFKATEDRASNLERMDYWRDRSDTFIEESMPCHHNEINHDENSRLLADRLNQLMEEHDA